MVASIKLRWPGSQSDPNASTMMSQYTADFMAEQMAHLSETGGVEEEDAEENKVKPFKVARAVEENNKGEDTKESNAEAVEVSYVVEKATEEVTEAKIMEVEKAAKETAEITKEPISEGLVVGDVDQVAEETSKTMEQAVEHTLVKEINNVSQHNSDMLDLLFEKLEGTVCSTLPPLFDSQFINKKTIAAFEPSVTNDSNAHVVVDRSPSVAPAPQNQAIVTVSNPTPQITDSPPNVVSMPRNGAIGMDIQDDVVTLHESGTMTSSWAVYDSPTESDSVDEENDSHDKLKDQSNQKMAAKQRKTIKYKSGADINKSGADINKCESSSSLKKGLLRLFQRCKEQASGKPKTGVILNKDSGGFLSRGIRKSKTSPNERERTVQTNGLNPRRIRTASPRTPLGQKRHPENKRGSRQGAREKAPQRSKNQLESKAHSQTRRGRSNTPPTRMKEAEDGQTSAQSRMSRGRSRQRTMHAPEKKNGKASSSGKSKRKLTRASTSATRKTIRLVKTLGDTQLGKEHLEVNLARTVDGSRMKAVPKSHKSLVRTAVQRGGKTHFNQAALRYRE
jgi:hypothetical protein